MTINISYESVADLDVNYETLTDEIAEKILDSENCPYEATINLVITDSDQIHRVNKEFRNIDAPTDVLSFPMIPFETPGDYSVVEEDDSYFDMDTGELLLGDMMINVDRVFSQAEEYGHSIEREFCFLFAHSMFHLLGYDHMEPKEAAEMEKKQSEVLEALGITR